MRRKIKVTVTKTRRWNLVALASEVRAYCQACGREVEALDDAQAARALGVEGRALDALVADGRVHAIQTVSGSLRVCRDSLFQPDRPRP